MPRGIRHWQSLTPTWYSWNSMMTRCLNENAPNFPSYGGRGITVCERWHSYIHFSADMGLRPDGTTLGRVDNDGNYEPGNCKWEFAHEQQNNRSNNRTVSIDGETKTVSEWARANGLSVDTAFSRIKRGWPPERAVSTKARGYRS